MQLQFIQSQAQLSAFLYLNQIKPGIYKCCINFNISDQLTRTLIKISLPTGNRQQVIDQSEGGYLKFAYQEMHMFP